MNCFAASLKNGSTGGKQSLELATLQGSSTSQWKKVHELHVEAPYGGFFFAIFPGQGCLFCTAMHLYIPPSPPRQFLSLFKKRKINIREGSGREFWHWGNGASTWSHGQRSVHRVHTFPHIHTQQQHLSVFIFFKSGERCTFGGHALATGKVPLMPQHHEKAPKSSSPAWGDTT